ncbi:MAG TPA: SigB/SigF/SigG family RNA polymerase sigma factor, partial [Thermoleophilaceae bacterium]|nr:SigB/SigF/SigG family RNA polymerase sigma factor [Thermoleophilaceae bacterium]
GSRESDRDLFRRYQLRRDGAAREALVRRFLPLTRQLARRYRRGSEPVEDLEQVASLALVKAIDRYDISRGTAFSTFLVPTVLGELKRHFRDSAWAAHVPRRMQERVMRVTHAIDSLSTESGHSPSVVDIAAATEQSIEQVLEAMEASHAYHARPLEGPDPDEDGEEPDHLAALGRPEAGYELVELGASVRPAVRAMPDREREILRLRFVEDLTQSQIAERVGISQMHVSRLIRAAVEQLQQASDEDAVAEGVAPA